MNKEELRKLIIDNSECLPKDMEIYLNEFEKQIQQDFLKEVLPEESKDCLLSVEPSTAFRERGFNACRKEIINNAKLKGIEL
jgi:hypothetical protein